MQEEVIIWVKPHSEGWFEILGLCDRSKLYQLQEEYEYSQCAGELRTATIERDDSGRVVSIAIGDEY